MLTDLSQWLYSGTLARRFDEEQQVRAALQRSSHLRTASFSQGWTIPMFRQLTSLYSFFPRLPESPGPFNVGTLDFESRARNPKHFGTFEQHKCKHKASLDLETVAFVLYYPTLAEGEEARRKYYQPKWIHKPAWTYAQAYVQSFSIPKYFSWLFSALALFLIYGVRIKTLEGAPLVSSHTEPETSDTTETRLPKRIPVIIFSHGLSGTPRVYSEICSAWASNGFIVCAVEHRDGTGPLVLVDPKKMPDDYRRQQVKSNGMAYLRTGTQLHRRIKQPAIKPENMAVTGDKAPDWTDPHDKTLELRRGQIQMRIFEIEECMENLHALDQGALDHTYLAWCRDGTGRERTLEDQTQCIKQFTGRLDLEDNISIAGHSFGGASAIESLRVSENPEKIKAAELRPKKWPFKLGILLDPWSSPVAPADEQSRAEEGTPHHPSADALLPRLPRERVSVPLLSISSTMFAHWSAVSPYTKAIIQEGFKESGKGVSLEVKGSIHLAQSDVPVLFNRTLLHLPMSALQVDAARCLDLNIKASLEFLRAILTLEGMPQPQEEPEAGIGEDCVRDRIGFGPLGMHKKQRPWKSKKEKVLEGEAPEVIIHFKQM